MVKSLLFAVALDLFAAVHAAPSWSIGQEVNTTSGRYVGHDSKLRPGVSEYLGIKYGQETSGARRFAKPVALVSSDKFTADKYSDDCPGILSKISGPMAQVAAAAGALNPASENCLSVNVWTKPQVGEKKKAVMVWVYGGGFNVGTANDKTFDGSIYAEEEDVVVVTLNYRLVVFGFPSGVDGVDKNVGLRDQRLALEWVKANIENFGGDTSRIMLFGQSAGGFSVDNYAYAWAKEKDPIVNGIIMQSGSASSNRGGGMVRSGNNAEAWAKQAKVLGCPTEGKASLECVRGKPWLDVLNAIRGGPTLSGGAMSSFSPSADGEVVFSNYEEQANKGLFIKVPIITGNNDDEAGGGAMNFFGGPKPDAATMARQNAGFSCPPSRAAEARVKAGLPTWRYRYMAAYPNTGVMPMAEPLPAHGAELTVMWGTMDNLNRSKSTPDELALSKNIRTAWSTFAKDPKEGLKKLGWPVYDASKPTLVVLGAKNKPETTFVSPSIYDAGCEEYFKSNATMGPPKGLIPPSPATGAIPKDSLPKGSVGSRARRVKA